MKKSLAVLAALSLSIGAAPAYAKKEDKSSGRKAQEAAQAQIPVCQRKLGAIAIVEPDYAWWSDYGLSSPEALLKVMVMKSGCFTLVDRGKGLQNRNLERALGDAGELQRGSNIGKRQVKAADYFLVPDLVSRNRDSGGGSVGGGLGGLIGGGLGAIAGGLKVKKKEANVTLTLVNSRTTEQERITEGYARKTDVGFGGGGLGVFGGALGAVGGSSYENTEIGQVMVLAYLKAYRDMVTQLGGLPLNPSAAAPKAE